VLTRAHDALPDDTLVSSLLVVSRQRRGVWEGAAVLRDDMTARIASDPWTGNASGYDFTAVCDDPALQRRVAERYAASEVDNVSAVSRDRRDPPARAPSRLRLGFVSSDYRDHPVGRLVVALFERMDRGAFEVVAYSTGVSADPLGARIEAAVDRFTALPRHAPDESAQRIRDDEIDVLFDLNGFSGGEALRIFARRPASLQVNFLGYTGSLGTDVYDAVVADLFCIPPDASQHYVERPLYVEPCYLPSDPARAPDATPRRAQYDLPDDAVVLYAGGPLYKVTPELVEAWLSILRDVPASLLWLRDPGRATRTRVEAHARARGLDPGRVRFAPDEPLGRYLARFGLADAMLDTWPFGSHTTVNDALFMGTPVVTRTGRSFASRASTSQLRAAGRGDLAADSLVGYVDIVRRLASDPARRADVRASLADVRRTPLFDADRYAASFAEAITQAWKTLPR
jgi:protein O-GlcNAc transferase